MMAEFLQNWQTLLINIGILIGAAAIGVLLHFIAFRILRRVQRRTTSRLYGSIVRHTHRPLAYLFPLLALNMAMPYAVLPQNVLDIVQSVLRSLFIFSISWLVVSLTAVGEDAILGRYDISARDNLQARKIHTQTRTIRQILTAIVIVVAIALVLMGFEAFREIGTGILASAGLISLVVGLAAQRIFGNLLAGIQIAFTQPIRLDDVVIVENEWGRVEEITLTYVVVLIWDMRRLVLPISYFIEKPFQNWTRVSADLLGTVFIYADYSVPVDKAREELHRILRESARWDGKAWGLQATDSTERTIQLRALMSAADASTAWDLRCEVREKLVGFIQKNYPSALPRQRTDTRITGVPNQANGTVPPPP